MDDSGEIPQNGKQDIDPEVLADSDLKEHPEGWQDYCRNDSNYIHDIPSLGKIVLVQREMENPRFF